MHTAIFIGVLCDILDGRTDIVPYPEDDPEPAEWMEESVSNPKKLCRDQLRLLSKYTDGDLASLKLALCALVGFFWDCRNDARLTMLIDMYDDIVDNKIGPSLFASVTKATATTGDKFMSIAPGDADDKEAVQLAEELELPLK